MNEKQKAARGDPGLDVVKVDLDLPDHDTNLDNINEFLRSKKGQVFPEFPTGNGKNRENIREIGRGNCYATGKPGIHSANEWYAAANCRDASIFSGPSKKL